MKHSLTSHCIYLLVTIGAFVVGSQLAGPFSSRSDVERQASSAQSVRIADDGTGLGVLTPGDESANSKTNSLSFEIGSDIAAGATWPPIAAANGRRFENYFALADGPLNKRQIEEMVLAAIKSGDPVVRRRAFDRLLQEMESETFTVAQAMAIRHTMHENGANGEQWRLFDYAWGANDPAAASAYIEQIPEQYRNGYTGNMLPGLASAAPQAAIELVAGMEGELRRRMTKRLLEGLADHDPAIATDYVLGLAEAGDPSARQHMSRLAREVLDTVGLEGGRQWAENLPDGQLQGAALVPIANEYANNDPVSAAQWAEQFVGQDQNSRVFGEIVREWKDWQAASVWVDSLEPGRAQRDGLSAVYGFRGAIQPEVAVQEIIAMPESPEKNFAINGFISGLAHQDGETAVIWAAEITSTGMREEAMVRAGRQFYRQDQQAATEWLVSSGLPEGRWNQVTGSR